MIDDLTAAREQRDLSISFHIVFAVLGVGMPWLNVVRAVAWPAHRGPALERTGQTLVQGGARAAPLQAVVGDWATRVFADVQPAKFAAMESLEHTMDGAPFHAGPFEIPKALSLLLKFDPTARVTGMDVVAAPGRSPWCTGRSRSWPGWARRWSRCGCGRCGCICATGAVARIR